jgi:hypothetical protein
MEALAGQATTPPIFQAGHEGSIPFARSNPKPQVKAGFLARNLIICPSWSTFRATNVPRGI